jgi:DNA polymerase elongation subunit (family B)
MNTISGGFVMPPSNGVAEWVGVLDLKSLYPSSMITCNISKETMTYDLEEADVIVPDMPLNYEDVPGDKITQSDIGWQLGEGACVGFTLDEQGVLPKYLSLLFQNRGDMKSKRDSQKQGSREYEMYDMRQRAIKVVMNSMFGVSDNPYFRLAADGLGAAITSVSRYVSWVGIQVIEDDGYTVRYGDTDSLMVSLLDNDGVSDDLDTKEYVGYMENLESSINERLSMVADNIGVPDEHPFFDGSLHGTDRHLWVYEAEKLYRRFLQTNAKKRYAGNIVWKEGKYVDDTDVSGYETQKSDSAAITQDVQEEFIERILEGQEYDELTAFIQEKVNGLESLKFDLEYVGFPSSLNKPIEEYPNMPVKRATKYSNRHLGYDWGAGDNPWLVYVDDTPPNLPNTDVIAVHWQDESLPSGFTINVPKHLEKSIQSPLQSIIDSLDFTWTELKTGKKEQSVIGSGGGEVSFNDGAETGDPFENL